MDCFEKGFISDESLKFLGVTMNPTCLTFFLDDEHFKKYEFMMDNLHLTRDDMHKIIYKNINALIDYLYDEAVEYLRK